MSWLLSCFLSAAYGKAKDVIASVGLSRGAYCRLKMEDEEAAGSRVTFWKEKGD
jgi:hypothetical protein